MIISTGFSNQLTDEKIRALDVQGVIQKPLLRRDIAEAIRKALQ